MEAHLEPGYQFLQVLACGDLRGNMVLFPLLKYLVLGTYVTQEVKKISPINHFKGVHGISSVTSVSVTMLGYNQIEICSVSLSIHPSNCSDPDFYYFSNDDNKSTVNILTHKYKYGCALLWFQL